MPSVQSTEDDLSTVFCITGRCISVSPLLCRQPPTHCLCPPQSPDKFLDHAFVILLRAAPLARPAKESLQRSLSTLDQLVEVSHLPCDTWMRCSGFGSREVCARSCSAKRRQEDEQLNASSSGREAAALPGCSEHVVTLPA